ncbi:uncharacterized protein LOC129748904 isoform X2 [Uranotaenia lowii]|nr:uncharacterized protein LOC129748904 isoform X2 [Uranotaenia lowii]
MRDSVERNRREENSRSSKTSRYCKTILLPDRLQEAVDRRVKFCARHGPQKHILQSFHNQTCYVIHDNIEISNPGESSVYSILTNAPIYKVEIEDGFDEKMHSGMGAAKRRKTRSHHGYVKLKSTEYIKPNNPTPLDVIDENGAEFLGESSGLNGFGKKNGRNSSSFDSGGSMDEEDDDDDEEDVPITNFGKMNFRDSVWMQRTKPSVGVNGLGKRIVPSTSTSSTSPPSSEYDYAYITAINKHQPLSIMKSINDDQPLSSTVLPDYCVTLITCSSELNQGYYSDDESDVDKLLGDLKGKTNRLEYVTERKQYLNSKGFLAYFINLFQDTISQDLEIKQHDLEKATWKGAVIYSGAWEIIPAIVCPWPREAFEWVQRKREIKINPLNKQKFQWPTAPMIQKVKSFGCHVIPTGYAPKQGQNRYRMLEWKMVFPEAERYLESCLTNTQAKVYMITKLLFRTFVDPAISSGMNMFGTEHLRAHLFWQCENNYVAWPEEYLGEALLRFLNALLERIKTHKLPDYFLPTRNLFENIPERALVELHKRIFRITENPLIHMMIALKNTKHLSGQAPFYPKIKIKRLYSIMAIDNPLKILNPRFRDEDENLAAEDSGEDEGKEKEVAVGFMAYFNEQEVESRKQRTRIVQFMEAEKKKQMEAGSDRKLSVDSIDLMFTPLKHMENVRRQMIYNIFVQHFIEMAQASCAFRSLNQGLVYLQQAERLCSLLNDDHGVEEARRYLSKIRNVRNDIQNALQNNYDGPALPKRASNAGAGANVRTSGRQMQQKGLKPGRKSRDRISYSNMGALMNGENGSPGNDRKKERRKISAQVHRQSSRNGDDSSLNVDITQLLGNVAVN